nr:hypothetical protein Iba_scaffold22998CG0010 [Ipomoea batatas]
MENARNYESQGQGCIKTCTRSNPSTTPNTTVYEATEATSSRHRARSSALDYLKVSNIELILRPPQSPEPETRLGTSEVHLAWDLRGDLAWDLRGALSVRPPRCT